MKEPLPVEALAFHLDHLAGRVAALASIIAHIPDLSLSDPRTKSSVETMALQFAPKTIQTGNVLAGSPAETAQNTVRKIAEIAQSLKAVQSAGQ